MIKKLYDKCNNSRNKNKSWWSLEYKLCKLYINLFYPLTQKSNKSMGIDKDGKFIVSLTSIPARINNVWMTIASLMNQTVKAKRIIIWLSEEAFPNGENDIPSSLVKLKNRGLEIRFCEDLMPHKKYFFTMKENPEDIVVTADDDVFYPEDTFEKLWKKHEEYPDAVCCMRGHVILFDEEGRLCKYNSWDSETKGHTTPSMQFFPVGNGTVLYPAHSLDERIYDKASLRELAIYADDIWLKTMEVLNGTKAVRAIPDTLIFFGMIGSKKSSLFVENADENRNDVILRNVFNRYPEVLDILKG